MKIREILIVSIFSAILVISKEIIAFLPNVEIVTLLLLVYIKVFSPKITISIVLVFCVLQTLLYGLSQWVIGYLIVWPALVIIGLLVLKITNSNYVFAIIAGIFGLLFDLPFAFVNGCLYGLNYAITYLLAGISFSVIHAFSNFIVVLILYKPLCHYMQKISSKHLISI